MTLWERAVQQTMAEMPNAPLSVQEARADEIYAALEAKEDDDDQKHWLSPRLHHPAGHMAADHREAGKRLMRKSGVNPDATLDVDWERTPDIRDNRDPQTVGIQTLLDRTAKGNGSALQG